MKTLLLLVALSVSGAAYAGGGIKPPSLPDLPGLPRGESDLYAPGPIQLPTLPPIKAIETEAFA